MLQHKGREIFSATQNETFTQYTVICVHVAMGAGIGSARSDTSKIKACCVTDNVCVIGPKDSRQKPI